MKKKAKNNNKKENEKGVGYTELLGRTFLFDLMADGRLPARRRMRGRVPGAAGALAASSSSSARRRELPEKHLRGIPRVTGGGGTGTWGVGPRSRPGTPEERRRFG